MWWRSRQEELSIEGKDGCCYCSGLSDTHQIFFFFTGKLSGDWTSVFHYEMIRKRGSRIIIPPSSFLDMMMEFAER